MSTELRTVQLKFGPMGKGECADVKVEWIPPFGTEDYTVSAIVEDSSPRGESLSLDRLCKRTPTAATFQISNRADENRSGILHISGSGDDTNINNNFQEVQDKVNAALAALRNLGLIAT